MKLTAQARLRQHAALMTIGSLALCGCSIERLAVNAVGNTLASGDSVFASDDDPELVRDALPFGLKLIDSLLLEQPDHRGLLLAGARGYVLYAYAFVAAPTEQTSFGDFEAALSARQRARNLYLRAHRYAMRALEIDHPGLGQALQREPMAAVGALDDASRDVPAAYWSAAALGLAISSSRNEPALLARLPEVEALLERALTVDPGWNDGALHEFAIQLASGAGGERGAALEEHYRRARELSSDERASLHVTFAEAVAVPRQDRRLFVELLDRALAVNVDARPDERLLNIMAQDRARRLRDRVDELFLE
jgi:predicted anti-sigma-YlaC factor YlaD